MTGPWQVNGRSLLSYDQMIVLDVNYVRHSSFAVDLRILLRTARAVITREGAF
jgi:lipopolysaccharide/colanic/teichoic acid biosynthesis glycosyltransferase